MLEPFFAVEENTATTPAITLSPKTQEKIVDSVILQGGGIGIGIIISFVGIIILAHWMGLKEAIVKWSEKQQVQSESLKSISDSLSLLLRETSSHIDEVREKNQATAQSLKDLDYKIASVQKDLHDFHQDWKEVTRNPKSR